MNLLNGASLQPASPRLDVLTNSLIISPLREFVRASAHSLQVHDDFMLMNVMGALSTAANGKLRVVRGAHHEAVQLYLLPIADPGERKSAAVNLARKPLLHSATTAPESAPTYVDDVTPTALKQALGAANGCLAAHTAEGSTMMKIMGQRGFAKGVFCAGYDAEDVRLDRANKKPIIIPDAALTLCLACQPSVALSFARTAEVSGQGLFARFFVAEFPPLAGKRDVHTERVADSTMKAYEEIVDRLLAIKKPETGCRHALELSVDAEVSFVAFCEQAERELGCGGRLSFDHAWGAKLHGKVLRIAALLHCVSEEDPLGTPITQESLRQAVAMADGFTQYAHLFFAQAADEIGEWAQQVLNLAMAWANGRCQRPSGSQCGEFNATDVRNSCPGLSSRKVGAAIERLLQNRMIMEFLPSYIQQCGVTRPGRKKAIKYIVPGFSLQTIPYIPAIGYAR